jgi:hypothetical protein
MSLSYAVISSLSRLGGGGFASRCAAQAIAYESAMAALNCYFPLVTVKDHMQAFGIAGGAESCLLKDRFCSFRSFFHTVDYYRLNVNKQVFREYLLTL